MQLVRTVLAVKVWKIIGKKLVCTTASTRDVFDYNLRTQCWMMCLHPAMYRRLRQGKVHKALGAVK